MRLLLDNNLSPMLSVALGVDGHDTAHSRAPGLQRAADSDVLAATRQQQRILVSADTDFGTLSARSGDAAASVILIHRAAHRERHLARRVCVGHN